MSVSELINLLKITLTSMVLRLETASTAGAMSRWRILLKRIMFHVKLCSKHDFTEIREVQPNVQDIPGSYRRCKEYSIFKTRDLWGIFVNFRTYSVHQEERFHLESDRLLNHSEMRLHQVTLHSVQEFEQMELEFFCEPDTDLEWFALLEEVLSLTGLHTGTERRRSTLS